MANSQFCTWFLIRILSAFQPPKFCQFRKMSFEILRSRYNVLLIELLKFRYPKSGENLNEVVPLVLIVILHNLLKVVRVIRLDCLEESLSRLVSV